MKNILYCKSNINNIIAQYCTTIEDVLSSDIFKNLIEKHIKKIKSNNLTLYNIFSNDSTLSDIEVISKLVLTINNLLLNKNISGYAKENKELFLEFISDFIECWKKIQKYGIFTNISHSEVIKKSYVLNKLILDMKLEINRLLGTEGKVYRKENLGTTADVLLSEQSNKFLSKYPTLSKVKFISYTYFETPIVFFTNNNKREGVFKESLTNSLNELELNSEEWLCQPIYVGELLAFIYFHKDFMNIGLSISNLFEVATSEDYLGRKPDIIQIYGYPNSDIEEHFYYDKEEKQVIGFLPYSIKLEYFGYIKKMLLTLHNIFMIEKGYLPIHGAMFEITFIDNTTKNILLMGDSGAGKSETIEAFKYVGQDKIKSIKVNFDDMGVLKIENNELLAYGTETGAFVRLDDLEFSVAFEHLENAIYMNPSTTNARMIIPITDYDYIIKGQKIDYFLYSNNYDIDGNLRIIKNITEALTVFKRGARVGKGTTNEVGLVTSYFANPFGPVQRRETCDKIIDKYFEFMYKNNVKVGEIYTKLSIPMLEKKGPQDAANYLIKKLYSNKQISWK